MRWWLTHRLVGQFEFYPSIVGPDEIVRPSPGGGWDIWTPRWYVRFWRRFP